jgi:hypothetical protein
MVLQLPCIAFLSEADWMVSLDHRMHSSLHKIERGCGMASSIITIGTAAIAFSSTLPPCGIKALVFIAAVFSAAWILVWSWIRWLETDPEPLPVSVRHVDIADGRGGNPLNWPLKAYIKLHNDSADAVEISNADWIANSQQAQLHLSPTEGIGWKFRVKDQESRSTIVPAGQDFEMWWGLNANYQFDDVQKKRDGKTLGTLVIYGKISGRNCEARFSV